MNRILKRYIVIYTVMVIVFLVAADISPAGMVSITFDDGLESVYTLAYPILSRHHQIATIGVVYKAVTSGSTEYMTKDQVLELQNHGWEVASHSHNHINPKKIPQTYEQEKIFGWVLENEKLHTYRAPYTYRSIAGLLNNGVTLQEVDSPDKIAHVPGSFYFDAQAGQLHIQPFQASDLAQIDIRSVSTQREMEYSKKELEELDFKIRTYVTPYDCWNDELKKISLSYYDYVVTGKRKANWKDSFDAHYIKRFVVRSHDTVESLIPLVMENAVKNDGWIIFCLHGIGDGSGWQPWSVEKLTKFAAWLHLMKIRVVTIAEGASAFTAGETQKN